MKARGPRGDAGSVDLEFDTIGLVFWPGIFGMLPAFLWLMALLYPVSLVVPDPAGLPHALQIVLVVIAFAAGVFVVMVLPALAAGLVQRARQPLGARLAWDDDGLVEWNGAWARTTIAWSRLEVAWAREPMRNSHMQAVQLRDRESGALVHVWDFAPSGAGPVRRRVYAKSTANMRELVDALAAHHPAFARARDEALARESSQQRVGAPDWSLAQDRWRPRWLVRLARLGYVGMVVASIAAIAPPSTASEITAGVIAVVSAALLALRAWPAYRELREVKRRWSSLQASDPEAIALRLQLRAVRAEVLLRTSFVVLAVHTPLAAALFSRAHP